MNEVSKPLTQAQVEKLWTGLGKHASAFAGARAMYHDLRAHGDYNTSYKQLANLLGKIPTYAQHLRISRLIRHRSIDLNIGVGETLQADIAEMPEDEDAEAADPKAVKPYTKILIAVDPFDNYLFAKAQKTKTMTETTTSMKAIIDENKLNDLKILGTDAGTEFTGKMFQAMLKKKNIKHHIFTGVHKAFQAERAIRTLKSRLYRSLRHQFTENWVERLDAVVAAINFSPSRGINNMVPAEVNDPSFNVEIREGRQLVRDKEEKYLPPVPKRTFKVGDYVYRDFGAKNSPFYKGYDFARGQIYAVYSKDDSKFPTTYKLIDRRPQNPVIQPGIFYASQLRAAPDPNKIVFPIEEILGERYSKRAKKKREVLVRHDCHDVLFAYKYACFFILG